MLAATTKGTGMAGAGDGITLEQLIGVVQEPQAERDLQEYFGEADDGEPSYSGSHFESFAGGGHRPATQDEITADDLVAVSMLSVEVPGWVALRIVDGSLGKAINDLLSQIDTSVTLGEEEAREFIQPEGLAAEAWDILVDKGEGSRARPGIGWVTAGKLLARKRPHLIPVYDSVVKCAVGAPKNYWTWLHDHLQASDQLSDSLAAHRRGVVPQVVSDIRILDVIVWMRHRAEHAAAKKAKGPCIGMFGGSAVGGAG